MRLLLGAVEALPESQRQHLSTAVVSLLMHYLPTLNGRNSCCLVIHIYSLSESAVCKHIQTIIYSNIHNQALCVWKVNACTGLPTSKL